MALNIEVMRRITERLHAPAVARAFGEEGFQTFRYLLEQVQAIYGFINPEQVKGTLAIACAVQPCDLEAIFGEAAEFQEAQYVAHQIDAPRLSGDVLVQISKAGGYKVWRNIPFDPDKVKDGLITYVYSSEAEYLLVKGTKHFFDNPERNLHVSIFAIPTFTSLDAALEDYKWRSVRRSRCQLFQEVWEGGASSNRVLLKRRPEADMRRSLANYLHNVLRNANVSPETNVDESHPVDVQVTWQFTNRIAIIEIKWMGASLSDSGNLVRYSDSRANAGAQQLAHYLDLKATWAPGYQVMGYLVVIDARRKSVDEASQAIDEPNGFHFRDAEIVFQPEYDKVRNDFVKPIRMFAEPICSLV